MHARARQAIILQTLHEQGLCSVKELSGRLQVSGETIRRDIKSMENKGLVERLHGGVALRNMFQEPAFLRRLDQNTEGKRAIARATAKGIKDGDSLIMDTGSTTIYVARALSQHKDLLVVTNCSEIARILSANSSNRVYMAGGEFRSDDSAVFGPSAITFIQQFRVRWAILSIGAVDITDGAMDFHLSEAEFSRAAIQQADNTVIVADHRKFGSKAAVRVCKLEDVVSIVTDRRPSDQFCQLLHAAGTNLHIA